MIGGCVYRSSGPGSLALEAHAHLKMAAEKAGTGNPGAVLLYWACSVGENDLCGEAHSSTRCGTPELWSSSGPPQLADQIKYHDLSVAEADRSAVVPRVEAVLVARLVRLTRRPLQGQHLTPFPMDRERLGAAYRAQWSPGSSGGASFPIIRFGRITKSTKEGHPCAPLKKVK